MTNEEKASQIANDMTLPWVTLGKPYDAIKQACEEMAEWKDKQCCANCEYLKIHNDKTLYAWCAKWDWNFLQFQADTRTTRCGQFKEKTSNE